MSSGLASVLNHTGPRVVQGRPRLQVTRRDHSDKIELSVGQETHGGIIESDLFAHTLKC